MLTYDFNRRGNEKMYEFLYNSVKNDILTQKLQEGERLPSKRALAKHLNISVITVETAYEMLAMEGYIYSAERKGYYVRRIPETLFTSDDSLLAEEPEILEPEYFVDFKANRISHSMFPKATWAKLMREVLSSEDENLLKTVPYNGLYILRKAIADYLVHCRGLTVSPAQIVIGAGTEYLYGRLIQLFGKGNCFALEDPGYGKFADIAENYGVKSEFVRINDAGLSVEELRKTKANILHISPSNHFPTGIMMPISRREELINWAHEGENRYIIEDDYDCELRYSGIMIPPMYSIDGGKKIVYINTFSKSMVPSIRISYMVLPQLLMHRYRESLSFYSCTVSSFEQCTLAMFISRGHFERHINRMKNYYKNIRRILTKEIMRSPLGKISQIEERPSGTHFVLVVRTDMSREEIYQAAGRESLHVSLLSEYCKTPIEAMDKTLIINYAGMEEDKIAEAVARMSRIFVKCD